MQGFRASIDPWKLINMSREKALMAAEKARERILKQMPISDDDLLKPLPLETKSGPLMTLEKVWLVWGLADTSHCQRERSSFTRTIFKPKKTIF